MFIHCIYTLLSISWAPFTNVPFFKWKHQFPSRSVRQCKINIQYFHSPKGSHVACDINWVQDFHLVWYLNPHVLLVKFRITFKPLYYQPPSLWSTKECDNEPKGTLFHDLWLAYFYSMKAMSWITADYLQ